MTTASRPFPGPAFLPALAYVVVTGLCVWLLRQPLAEAPIWLRTMVSLLPLLPISLAVRAVVRLVQAGDELQRRIDLEAMAAASVLVGLGSLTLSLLITADVVQVTGRQATLWVFPALWLGYGLARIWAARRYR
jgi:hypothetical protein